MATPRSSAACGKVSATAAGRGGDVAYEEVAAFAAGMPDGEAVKRFLRERVGA